MHRSTADDPPRGSPPPMIWATPAPWVMAACARENDMGCRCAPRRSGRAHRHDGGSCCAQSPDLAVPVARPRNATAGWSDYSLETAAGSGGRVAHPRPDPSGVPDQQSVREATYLRLGRQVPVCRRHRGRARLARVRGHRVTTHVRSVVGDETTMTRSFCSSREGDRIVWCVAAVFRGGPKASTRFRLTRV